MNKTLTDSSALRQPNPTPPHPKPKRYGLRAALLNAWHSIDWERVLVVSLWMAGFGLTFFLLALLGHLTSL